MPLVTASVIVTNALIEASGQSEVQRTCSEKEGYDITGVIIAEQYKEHL